MKRLFSCIFFFCLIVGILGSCSNSSSDVYPPACYVQLERNGIVYEEYAVQGQVWLLFDDDISQKEAAQFLRENGAKIIDAEREIGYYLVEVKPGTEGEFVSKMQNCWEVDYVYPNAIYELQSAVPYAFDNFVGTHGKKVAQMMKEASSIDVNMRDISPYSDTQYRMQETGANVYSFGFEMFLANSISTAKRGNDVVINFSFGPTLGRHENGVKKRWRDVGITDYMKSNYIARSIKELVGLNKVIQRYSNWFNKSNFVIVKAAGNEGMKNMEIVFDGVQQELSYNEYQFFEDHFLIVSAKDDYKGKNNDVDYPNDVYDGGYHEMMSKVDISDKTVIDTNWCGTSFSSPRLAGYIVRAANQFEMPVTEVLQYVRIATRKAPGHVVNYEMIEKLIKQEGIDPASDLIGQTIHDPSENGYFGRRWSWKLEPGEVKSVSEISREAFDKNTIAVTVLARLLRGEMEVDATIAMVYKKTRHDRQLSYIRTMDLTIPEQTDYSQYVEVKYELDVNRSEIVAYNHSPYTLFVVGDYVTLNGKSHRFVTIIEAGGSNVVAAYTLMESYSIRFAYMM